MEFFPMHDSVACVIGYLENTGLWSHANVKALTLFYDAVSKIMFIRISTDIIRKVFVY